MNAWSLALGNLTSAAAMPIFGSRSVQHKPEVEMRTCTKCKDTKPLDQFRYQMSLCRHRSECQVCERARQREVRANRAGEKRAAHLKQMRAWRKELKHASR